jgi:hypothetical protein
MGDNEDANLVLKSAGPALLPEASSPSDQRLAKDSLNVDFKVSYISNITDPHAMSATY